MMGYVMQDDMFITTLTPREHLQFNARLRLGSTVPPNLRQKRVEDLISQLGLLKCSDTMIGGAPSPIKGLSGGERKRLSFATELIGNPSIIFADEVSVLFPPSFWMLRLREYSTLCSPLLA
jgi:ABC-type multidrug transport system ATPase subunit